MKSIVHQVSLEPQNLLKTILNYIYQICTCFYFRRFFNLRYLKHNKPIDIPQQKSIYKGRKTLVVDLDETLVHSSFTYIPDADFVLNPQIRVHSANYKVYVRVRPGAEEFIREMAKVYEIFIFTASLAEYANPVIDRIDPQGFVALRLFRENCKLHNGLLVKDLSSLNRDIRDIIIIDNSQNSFMLQPLNAVHIKNFFSDQTDTELYDLMPFLRLLLNFQDVRPVHEWLHKFNHFEKFTFTNVNGIRIKFQRNPEDDQIIQQEEDLYDSEISIPMESPNSEDTRLIKGVGGHMKQALKLATMQQKQQDGSEDEEEELSNATRKEANINSPHSINKSLKGDIFILQEDEV